MGAVRPFYPPHFWVWCRERLKPETFQYINSDAGAHDREKCLAAFAYEQREHKHAAWKKAKAAKSLSSKIERTMNHG